MVFTVTIVTVPSIVEVLEKLPVPRVGAKDAEEPGTNEEETRGVLVEFEPPIGVADGASELVATGAELLEALPEGSPLVGNVVGVLDPEGGAALLDLSLLASLAPAMVRFLKFGEIESSVPPIASPRSLILFFKGRIPNVSFSSAFSMKLFRSSLGHF